MKSVVATVTLLLCLSCALARPIAHHSAFLSDQEDSQSVYYVQGVRGMFLGFEHGLFKTKDSDKCLDD